MTRTAVPFILKDGAKSSIRRLLVLGSATGSSASVDATVSVSATGHRRTNAQFLQLGTTAFWNPNGAVFLEVTMKHAKRFFLLAATSTLICLPPAVAQGSGGVAKDKHTTTSVSLEQIRAFGRALIASVRVTSKGIASSSKNTKSSCHGPNGNPNDPDSQCDEYIPPEAGDECGRSCTGIGDGP